MRCRKLLRGFEGEKCAQHAHANIAGSFARSVMMKRALVLVLALAVSAASAQSVLLGKRLLGKGDEIASARDAGGAPQRIDRIEGDDSTPAMEIWTYVRKGREITFWVVDGRIVKVQEKEAPAAAP